MHEYNDLLESAKRAGVIFNGSGPLDLARIHEHLAKILGPVRACKMLFEHCWDLTTHNTLFVDICTSLNIPMLIIDRTSLERLFDAAPLHSKRRILFALARSPNANEAHYLISRVESVHRDRLTTFALLAEADRKLLFQDGRSLLGHFVVEADDSECLFCAILTNEWDLDRRIIQGSHRIVSFPTSTATIGAIQFPLLTRKLFSDQDPNTSIDSITATELLSYLTLLKENRKYNTLIQKLVIIADNDYLIHDDKIKIIVASIIMKLITEGVAIPAVILGFVAGQLIWSGRLEQLTPLMASVRLLKFAELGEQTFFELRRLCAFAPSIMLRREWAQKFACSSSNTNIDSSPHQFFSQLSHDKFESPVISDTSTSFNWTDLLGVNVVRSSSRKHNPDAPRIALVLSGQLRGFRSVFAKLWRQVIEPLNADVFIATWDSTGLSGGANNDLERLIDRSILDAIPPELRVFDAFFDHFKSLHRALMATSSQSIDEIRSTGINAEVIICDEASFDSILNNHFDETILNNWVLRNQLKQFFMMKLCGERLSEIISCTDNNYDIVIRMRPDLDVTRFVYSDVFERNLEDDVIVVPHSHPVGVADHFAYGTTAAMLKYFSMFDHIWAAKGFSPFPSSRNGYGEAFLFDTLSLQGFRFHCNPNLLRYKFSSRSLTINETIELMLPDLSDFQSASENLKLLRR